MQPRVTAVLVARNVEEWLERTLAGLAAQTRPVDRVLLADAGSTDRTRSILAAADSRAVLAVGSSSWGGAVRDALGAVPPDVPAEGVEDWVWLLGGDTIPEPQALARLLAAIEVAPSVAIAGPKLVRPDDRATIVSFGLTLTRSGETVPLVDGELDQAQHDRERDVLAVESSGMLVKREVWERLGGFDRGLPGVDAGLDLAVRARLAGSRVIRVPDARVALARRPEDFGRSRPLRGRPRATQLRRAHLHRRLTYAPAIAVPLLWLGLVPLALIRSVGHLLAKRPQRIGGELAAAFRAAFDPSVPAARRGIRRTRRLGWAALQPLRIAPDRLRVIRAAQRDREAGANPEPDLVRAGFLSGGGGWIVLVALVLGVVLGWRLVQAQQLAGGGLLPLSGDLATLWSHVLPGARNGAPGVAGPADPFVAVVALLGSLTPWNPSYAFVLLWLAALPLAALGAWWAATRLSSRRLPPAVAAVLWMLAPPLLVALGEGRPAAVLVHLVLPWLVLAAIEGVRSWSAAATAALLLAVVVAGAPTLGIPLAVLAIIWALAHPRALVRLIGLPIPAAALAAPLVVVQVQRGTPLGVLADPGVALVSTAGSGWHLLLGQPTAAATGWTGVAAAFGLPAAGPIVAVVLAAPLAVLALLALFLPGSTRALPAGLVALVGLATAVAAGHLVVGSSGADALVPWAGAGLSLYWLGLVGMAVIALDALAARAALAGILLLLTSAAAAGPLAATLVLGGGAVTPGTGPQVPALVSAAATTRPDIATLVLTPQADGTLAAALIRGDGLRLDTTSTLVATRATGTADQALAQLAGNLASRSGYDAAPALRAASIGFVQLVPGATATSASAAALHQRVAESLDADATLSPVGDTSLWRFPGVGTAAAPAAADDPLATAGLVGQGVVLLIALLLALPTRRGRRTVREPDRVALDGPAETFDEEEHG